MTADADGSDAEPALRCTIVIRPPRTPVSAQSRARTAIAQRDRCAQEHAHAERARQRLGEDRRDVDGDERTDRGERERARVRAR